jgi:Rrf2 family transcriptional regulator, iron-sulfur cluster assembly transcription factor
MMQLSKTSGYAIHALSRLAMAGDDSCMIREVAQHIGIGSASLAKLLTQLTSHGLVHTKRGYHGGITIARSPESITLLEVVEAMEEKQWIGDCPFGLQNCPTNCQCPAHEPWKIMREQLHNLLARTTVADIMRSTLQNKKQPSKSAATAAGRTSTFFVFPDETTSIRQLR